jgi:anti-sigma regulatory factor (Ser/Thr protein kinase)
LVLIVEAVSSLELRPRRLQHLHLTYRGLPDLVGQVAPDVVAGLDRGEAVLACLPDDQWAALASGLGARASEVVHRPADDRYASPAAAMAMLSEFVEECLSAHATGVQSIGAIDYDGTPADTPWLRYEAAVNEMFADVPLRAVCLADATRTPASVLANAANVHDHDGCEPSADAQRAFLRSLPPSIEAPATSPDIELLDATTRSARAAIAQTMGADLTRDARAELDLVVCELVTNAIRYTTGRTRLRMWLEAHEVLIAMSDGGHGINDLAAGFRPAGLDEGGRGLWIVQQFCSAVDYEVTASGHTVLARFPRS